METLKTIERVNALQGKETLTDAESKQLSELKVSLTSDTLVALNDSTFNSAVIKELLKGTNKMLCAKVVEVENATLYKMYAVENRKHTFSISIGGKTIDNDSSVLRAVWLSMPTGVIKVGQLTDNVSMSGIMLLTYSKSNDVFYNIVRPFRSETEQQQAIQNKLPILRTNVGKIFVNLRQVIGGFQSLVTANNVDSFVQSCSNLGIDATKYLTDSGADSDESDFDF
jgi:hypothetical protein